MAANNRFEYIHPKDAATAFVNSLTDFQRYSFEDFKRENFARFRLLRPLVRPFSPVIRRILKQAVRF